MKIALNNKIFILIVGTIFSNGLAQNKLEIINADAGRGEKTEQGTVRHLEGNIHLRQGTAELYCQQVTWYVDLDKTILQTDVKYVDGLKILQADKIIYFNEKQIAQAIGNVTVIDSVYKMTSDFATYYELEERITAEHNVILTDNSNLITLTGDFGEFYSEREYAKVTGHPMLTQQDSSGKSDIKVTGEVMEMFENGDRAVITNNVVINHNSGTATCNKAIFYRSENRLVLKEEPQVQQKYDNLTGKEIELFIEKEKLNKVIIKENAVVSSRVDTTFEDSRYNKLLGNQITLEVDNNQLKKVFVEGMATCLYYIIEKEEYKGLNKIIGDKIIMTLDDGKIGRIIIDSEPQSSSGVFYPPGLEKSDI